MCEYSPAILRILACVAERSNGYNNRSSRRGPPLAQKVVHVNPRDHDGPGSTATQWFPRLEPVLCFHKTMQIVK
jgi:hypothetical protein